MCIVLNVLHIGMHACSWYIFIIVVIALLLLLLLISKFVFFSVIFANLFFTHYNSMDRVMYIHMYVFILTYPGVLFVGL